MTLAFLRDVMIISELARLQESRYQEAQQALAEEARREKVAQAAAAHKRLLKILTESHRIKLKCMDWNAIVESPAPEDAAHYATNERAALQALAEYRPSLWAFLSGGTKRRRLELETLVADARIKDRISQQRMQQLVEDRRRKRNLARDVLSLKPDALIGAFRQQAEFKDVGVEKVHVDITDTQISVLIDAMELEDMPVFTFSTSEDGELIRRSLTVEERIRLYRDNICSSAIRVSAEALCIMPVNEVHVTVHADILNRSTGHTKAEPILRMSVTLEALAATNLVMADPVHLAIHLGTQFDWDAQEGFKPLNVA